jgi:hypothetical protein
VLHVRLESALPASLPAGSRTVLFCAGTCRHEREPVAEVTIVADGVRHVPQAQRMPWREAGRVGFWGTVPVGGPSELALAVRLRSGREELAALGTIAAREPDPPPPAAGAAIAVCLATHEPDLERLAEQVASLRAQTERDWVCVVSDDASAPDTFAAIERLVAGDGRFSTSRSARRLGFYRNFERALALVPPDVEAVALCDQDDRWHPAKLALLREALGGGQLAFSDLRLVDGEGRVLRETLWEGRRNDHADLASLLVANSVPGASMLLRRSLLEIALPFPEVPGVPFHDHWLALSALTAGEIAYVDRPLYDYVRHGAAVLGGAAEAGRRRSPGRAAYFDGYLPRVVMAQTLLERCPSATAPKRRVLARFIAAERSLRALAWLLGRGVPRREVTLGGERALARGIAWRRLAAATARLRPRGDTGPSGDEGFEQPRLRRWIGGV